MPIQLDTGKYMLCTDQKMTLQHLKWMSNAKIQIFIAIGTLQHTVIGTLQHTVIGTLQHTVIASGKLEIRSSH